MRLQPIATLAMFLIIITTAAYVSYEVLNFITDSSVTYIYKRNIRVDDIVEISIPYIRMHDRLYIVVDGFINIQQIEIKPIDVIQLPIQVEMWDHDVVPTLMHEKRYMFIARDDAEEASLILRFQPLIPYVVKDLEGKHKYRVLRECIPNTICVHITPLKFHENDYSQILLIHPIKLRVEPDFRVEGRVTVLEGKVSYINIIIMTNWKWYAYRVVDPLTPRNTSVDFIIDLFTRDIYGVAGELIGEDISAIAIGIGFSKNTREEPLGAVVGIGDVIVHNGEKAHGVEPVVKETFDAELRIYLLRKFRPSNYYVVAVVIFTILLISMTLAVTGLYRYSLR